MKKNMVPIIGMVLGFVLILWSIMSSGDLMSFVDIPSLVITIAGSFCALLIMFPLETLKNIPRTLSALTKSNNTDKKELIANFVEFAKKARVNGLLSLEDDIEELDNDLMQLGLQMAIDGMEPEIVRDTMDLKLATVQKRHSEGQAVFSQWGELAPGFGMLGTIVGLIIMLSDLEGGDIGAGMATALITTFYGSLFANLVFLPIAENLSGATEEEMFIGDMIIEGVIELQAGSNPRLIEEKLTTYLSPEEQLEFIELQTGKQKEEAYE